MNFMDSIINFFFEKPVSILDAIIVSIISMIVISALKSVWKSFLTSIVKVAKCVLKLIRKVKFQFKFHRKNNDLLKNGEITPMVYEHLARKRDSGKKLRRLEKKAMERASDEVKSQGEKLAKIDFKKVAEFMKDNNPKIF